MDNLQILIFATIILFAFKVFSDSLYLLWLFQIKEYRLDRMKSHLRETIHLNVSDILILTGVSVLLTLFFPVTARFIGVTAALTLGAIAPVFFLYSFFRFILGLSKRSFKRPKATLKILLISAVYLATFSVFVYFLTSYIVRSVDIVYTLDFFILFAFYLLILLLLMPFFILFAILLITPITDFQKRRIMAKARDKMADMKHIKTIGITGSYGKTSTKEFLYGILATKYKVVKTSGNNNTNMGVAGTILREVSDDYDYFICEMGAYRVGEIKETASIAKPFAGIITGINEQHLDLFGSLENTKRGKFELIRALPQDGFAVISQRADEMKPKLGYNVRDVVRFSSDIVSDVNTQPDYVEFTYKDTVFRLNMLGKHYIENLLSAIIVAEKLGMSLEEIRQAVGSLEIEDGHLMNKAYGPKGAVFIDDSYSANPTGVIAALEYMEDAYPDKKKMMVFPGIIELGKSSGEIHKKIWEKTDDVCLFAFLLQEEDKDIPQAYQKCHFVFEKDFDRMKKEIEKRIGSDSVILFESRGAGVVMRKILADKEKNNA